MVETHLSTAWLSSAGFQEGENRMARSVPVNVKPTPPEIKI